MNLPETHASHRHVDQTAFVVSYQIGQHVRARATTLVPHQIVVQNVLSVLNVVNN